jgi:hypothetical protein
MTWDWFHARIWTLCLALLVILASVAGLPAAANAARTEVQPAEETFAVILDHKRPGSLPEDLEGTHVLQLGIYPLRGVAVVTTASNNYEIESRQLVTYAERIPKGLFDGHLDLHFKGLGSFVGDFVPHETDTEHRQKGCDGARGVFQLGTFKGRIEFHGGGFRGWTASRAVGLLRRSPRLRCRHGAAEHVRKRKTLFDYTSLGFGSFNGWRYGLRARLRRPHRITELAVYRYERNSSVNFDTTTYEWLPGGIAAGRAVFRSVPGRAHLQASHGGYHPEEATLRPPKPYSGIGTYSRATHRLTGSLAVQFPGLKLRLGSADTVADLVDEAGRRSGGR